jgi:glutathione S-transferase
MWHGVRVGGFRRAAKIPYPNCYASPEQIESSDADLSKARYLFNCAQRAHANFIENYTAALASWMVAGVQYPLTAAGLGAAWCVFRILYARGYTRADKEKGNGRYAGSGFFLAQLGLFGLVGKMAYDFLMV